MAGLQPGTEYTFRVCPVRCATAPSQRQRGQNQLRQQRRAAQRAARRQHHGKLNGSDDRIDDDAVAADDHSNEQSKRSTSTNSRRSSSKDSSDGYDDDGNVEELGNNDADDDDDESEQGQQATVDHFGPFSGAVRHTTAMPSAAGASTNNHVGGSANATEALSATQSSSASASALHAESRPRAWMRFAWRRFRAHCHGDDSLPETEHACFLMVMFLLFCLLCTCLVRFALTFRSSKMQEGE